MERITSQLLLEGVLGRSLNMSQVCYIHENWNAFYNNPIDYKNSVVVDMVKQDLSYLVTIEEAMKMVLDARRGLRSFDSVRYFLSDDRYNLTDDARQYIEENA